MLRHAEIGAFVAVTGELMLSAVSGPVEDELCVVRVGIEAEHVRFGLMTEPSP